MVEQDMYLDEAEEEIEKYGDDARYIVYDGVQYSKADDHHFNVTAQVEISDQFFGWVCGFGDKAKITAPSRVVEKFSDYLNRIKTLY